MRHEINPKQKIVIVFDGVEHVCNKPKLGAVLAMESRVDDAKATGKSGTQVMVDFIVSCGLPLEVVLELDDAQTEEVMKIICDSKKNS